MAFALKRFSPLLALTTLSLMACGLNADDQDASDQKIQVETETTDLHVTTVTDGLSNPWGMVFLPNGDMLVTERSGDMRVVTPKGEKGPALKGLPEIASRGQGGLLDVILDPNFDENRWVYFSFSEPGEGGTSTAVARGKLSDDALTDVEVIFSQKPKVNSNGHFGSRLVFTDDGMLFITMGDRQQDFEENYPQKLDSHIGTVARIHPDGSVPEDNPFVDREGALPEIWSYGHRNIQGADLHPETRELWTGEHGPQGGDEINITEAGNNYGWPIITYGEHYGGGEIGEGITEKEGMEQPVHYWVPSIANAGMTFYTGDKFPEWQGNLLVTALKDQLVARLVFDDEDSNKVTHEERMFADSVGKRLRDIVQGPDGYLYLLTDERNGAILKVEPVKE